MGVGKSGIGLVLGGVLLAGGLACDTLILEVCSENLRVSLRFGDAAPAGSVAAWNPPCGVRRLSVVEVALDGPGRPVWEIRSARGEASIVPPVRYGVVPRGAVETVAPAPLEPGVAYELRLNEAPDLD